MMVYIRESCHTIIIGHEDCYRIYRCSVNGLLSWRIRIPSSVIWENIFVPLDLYVATIIIVDISGTKSDTHFREFRLLLLSCGLQYPGTFLMFPLYVVIIRVQKLPRCFVRGWTYLWDFSYSLVRLLTPRSLFLSAMGREHAETGKLLSLIKTHFHPNQYFKWLRSKIAYFIYLRRLVN